MELDSSHRRVIEEVPMKGNGRKRELERVSLNAWGYERGDYGESWTVIAWIKGTAGNLKEYCYARLYRFNDGSEELEYISPAEPDWC